MASKIVYLGVQHGLFQREEFVRFLRMRTGGAMADPGKLERQLPSGTIISGYGLSTIHPCKNEMHFGVVAYIHDPYNVAITYTNHSDFGDVCVSLFGPEDKISDIEKKIADTAKTFDNKDWKQYWLANAKLIK